MKHRMRFDAALAVLRAQQATLVEQLRVAPAGDVGDAPREALLVAKRELDQAVACLRFCEQHQIHPDASVQRLPWPADYFGSFVLQEVDEMDHPLDMAPLAVNGTVLSLGAGDLLIQQGHGFNLPEAAHTTGDTR